MKIALKNPAVNCFRKFKRLQLTFQVVFHLALPTRPDGAQAIETLKAVVVAMGAHLKHEEGSVLEAAWDGTADVQGSLGFQASATGRVRELTLTCLKISGGAEVLCRDVERRYRAQYR